MFLLFLFVAAFVVSIHRVVVVGIVLGAEVHLVGNLFAFIAIDTFHIFLRGHFLGFDEDWHWRSSERPFGDVKTSFEYMSCLMFSGRSLVRVAVIIRPPCENALSEEAELAGMEKTALK